MRQGRFADIGGTEGTGPLTRLRLVLLPLAVSVVVALAAVAQAPSIAQGWPYWSAALFSVFGGLAVAGWRIARLGQDDGSPDDARWQGFVVMLEEDAGNWFWETNADGRLTYLSDSFRATLDSETAAAVEGQFAERLVIGQVGERTSRQTLAFHLKSRFPFRDLIVSPEHNRDLGWLLSGAPRFDAVGRFRGFRGCGVSLTEQRREVAAADRKARFDSLTGLPNRANMESLLDEAIANADERKQSCALFLVDLDRFKAVNDTLGHPVGDVVLQQASERMKSIVGADGHVGRLGGDEFEAIFPGIGEEGQLAAIAERLIHAVSQPYVIQGHNVSIGASVGISISRPGHTHRAALVKEADLAVYAAKHAGRGTFRFFETEMHDEETDRLILQSDFRDALAKHQLKLMYQPVVSVEDETLVGFEALVRWWHPTRGPLNPDEFLPIAAAARQLPALGEWVLRTAFAEAATWPPTVRLIVNLAPAQFVPGLPAAVMSALAASRLEAPRVEFDMHQESLVTTDPVVADILAALQGIGVRFSLDDFGRRGADITPLRSGSINRVKLDPGFYRLAATDQGHRIVAGLVRIARDCGLRVTAEGAESLSDLELVRGVGCTDVQGFLFGRPMPPEEAATLTGQPRPVIGQTGPMQQRLPRHRLIRTGYLTAAGIDWAVRLRNISSGGAMVECGAELPEGVKVALDLGENVLLPATVRWSHDGRVGMQFAEAFDITLLAPRRKEPSDIKMLQPNYLKGPAREAAPEAEIERLRIQRLRQAAVKHGRKG